MTTQFNLELLKEYLADTILYLEELYDDEIEITEQSDLVIATAKLKYVLGGMFDISDYMDTYVAQLLSVSRELDNQRDEVVDIVTYNNNLLRKANRRMQE